MVVDLILKTWKLLSLKNITFSHCSVVNCACFFAKARCCFFYSLINQRLSGCFTTRNIQCFLKVMLDCLDFYLLQQLWVEILQLQGCQTRVLLEFSFHDGVSQSKCLFLFHPLNLCSGIVLFGSMEPEAWSLMMVAFPLPLCFYRHLFVPPWKNISFFFITSVLSRHIE